MRYFAKYTGFSKLIHSHVYAYWRYVEFRGTEAITFTEDSESEMVLAHLNRFIMESNNKRMFLCMCKCGTCSHLMCDPFWENRPYCLGQNIFGIQVNHLVYYSYIMAKTAMVVTFWHF